MLNNFNYDNPLAPGGMAKGSARQPPPQDGASSGQKGKQIKYLVSPDKVGRIIGKRGVTINEIKQNSGAKIDVTDDMEKQQKVVYISGKDAQIQKAKSLIDELLRSSPSTVIIENKSAPEETITFKIPEDRCGLVIGVRGAKIREIQDRTNVKVKIGSKDSASGGMTEVTLRGDKEGCRRAKEIVDELIDYSEYDDEDEPAYSETIKIPVNKIRAVIGQGGVRVRDIEDRSGAKIDVGRRNSAVDGKVDVKLSGCKESCSSASAEIRKILQEDEDVTSNIWIDVNVVGLVIGYRGSKIKEIQNESGASVKVDKRENARDGKIGVTLSGSRKEIEIAEEIIEKILSQSNDQDDEEAEEDQYSITMWVPSNKCGIIIGSRGLKINQIQSRTNTRIDVYSKELNDKGECQIKISGEKDCCDNARSEIKNIVQEVEVSREENERGTLDLWVPSSSLGKIIGRGGATVHDIENMFKIKVDVQKDSVDEGETLIVLIGYRTPVTEARQHILEMIGED